MDSNVSSKDEADSTRPYEIYINDETGSFNKMTKIQPSQVEIVFNHLQDYFMFVQDVGPSTL